MTKQERIDSLFANTKNISGCLVWQGAISQKRIASPYPSTYFNGKNWKGHRLIWTLICGEIPDGLWVLHRCNHSLCLNPEHLYLGDAKQNMQDRLRAGNNPLKERTVCIRGHALVGINVRMRKNGSRACRLCNTLRIQEQNRKSKDARHKARPELKTRKTYVHWKHKLKGKK